jgi:hypothetical protein
MVYGFDGGGDGDIPSAASPPSVPSLSVAAVAVPPDPSSANELQ